MRVFLADMQLLAIDPAATPLTHSIISQHRNPLLHWHFFRSSHEFTVSPTDTLRRLAP